MARLAGLPAPVIARAKEILGGLERDELSRGGRPTLSGGAGDPRSSQLVLFAPPPSDEMQPGREEVVGRRLKEIDVDDVTPRQALELLAELKKLVE